MFVGSCPIRGNMFICLTQISKFALVTSQLFCWSTSILFVIRHTVVGSPCLLITSLGQNFSLFHWFKTYKSHLKALKSQHFSWDSLRFSNFLLFPITGAFEAQAPAPRPPFPSTRAGASIHRTWSVRCSAQSRSGRWRARSRRGALLGGPGASSGDFLGEISMGRSLDDIGDRLIRWNSMFQNGSAMKMVDLVMSPHKKFGDNPRIIYSPFSHW